MTEPDAPRYRWAILAVGAFGASAFAMFRMGLPSLGPELRDHYGLSLGQVGLVFTSVAIGVGLGLVPWGVVTDRVGERPVMASGLALFAAVLAATAFASSFTVLLAGLLVCGVMGASTTGASGRAIMGWFGVTERGRALGIRQMSIPVGGALGSLSLPWLAHANGIQAAFLVLAGISLTAAVCSALWIRDAPAVEKNVADIDQPMTDARQWRLGGASALLAVGQSAALGFTVLFLHDERGLSVGAAAAALAAIQVLGGAGRIVSGWRSDRKGVRIPLLRTISAATGVLYVATAVLTNAPAVFLYPVLLCVGVSALSWNALAFTAAAEIAGLTRAGTAMGLQNTIVTVGSIVAPVGFGVLVGLTSYAVGYAVVAVCPLAAFVLLRALEVDEAERARARRAVVASAVLRSTAHGSSPRVGG